MHKMSSDVTTKCGTCLSATNFYHQLYDCVEENYKILDMLKAIVPQIDYTSSNIQLPIIVCDHCVKKLLTGYKFHCLCIESNKILQDFLFVNSFEVVEPKLETIEDPLTEMQSFKMKGEFNEGYFKSEMTREKHLQGEDSENDLNEKDNGGGGVDSVADSRTSKQNHVKRSCSCIKCSKVFSNIKHIKRHLDKHDKQLKFLCEICSLSFATKKSLKTHMLSHANKNNSFKVPKLNKQLDLENKEAKVEDKLQTFQCIQYYKVFDKKSALASHLKVHKKNNECKETSANEHEFKEEMEIIARTNDGEFLNTDLEETDCSNDTDMNMMPNHTLQESEIVVDYIDTGVGEIEKPNISNKRKGYFPCETCGKVYDRRSTLKRHTIVHSADRPYECEYCTYRFASLNGLKVHEHLHKQNPDDLKKPQRNPEGFKCTYCPRRFEKKSSLTAHQHQHTRKNNEINYPCMHCEQKFQLVKSLTEHIAVAHPEVEKHNCDQCDKTFVLHAHLVEHLNRHKGNLNLVCIICEKEFSYNNVLLEHMRTHTGDTPYLCYQCGKSFRSFTTLHMHLERHANLKKYQCPECPSRFNCRSDVLKHSSVHSKVKPHVCDICGTGFSRRYSLRYHKIIHTGERHFKCEECGVSFVTNNQLQRHLRIHTGERPFKCKYCERTYASGGDLKKHLRSHLGKNTYICDECPMAFKYKAELRDHKSEHFKMKQKLAKDTIEQKSLQ